MIFSLTVLAQLQKFWRKIRMKKFYPIKLTEHFLPPNFFLITVLEEGFQDF